MKALITGGSGFCGHHLIRYLRNQSVEVFTLAPRLGNNNHFSIQSVDDGAGMTAALRELRPDFIFHLAGIARSKDPGLVYRVNVEYGAELLHALDSAGQKATPVLLVGTAAEYGMIAEKDLPVREDHPARPYNHYGISKLAQTLMGLAAAEEGHRVVIARPTNIIGPGMSSHLLLGRLAREIDRIAKGDKEPRIELGNLQAARDFIDVGDVVAIYWSLIRNPKAYGEVINVCTGQGTSIRTVVESLISLSGMAVELSSKPALFRTHDPALFFGCTEKLHRMVGSVPRLDLARTLRRILATLASKQ
jgi:nucleoside-diphosphate-sugar epimerase